MRRSESSTKRGIRRSNTQQRLRSGRGSCNRSTIRPCRRSGPNTPCEPKSSEGPQREHQQRERSQVQQMAHEITEALILHEREVFPFREHSERERQNPAANCERHRAVLRKPTRPYSHQHARQRQRVESLPRKPAEDEVTHDSARQCSSHTESKADEWVSRSGLSIH